MLNSRYKIDLRPSLPGTTVILWDGDQEMGRTYPLFDDNWAVESSNCLTAKTYTSLDKAIDAIIFEWEGLALDSGRLSEWVLDRMAS